jgi:hypothetical protein
MLGSKKPSGLGRPSIQNGSRLHLLASPAYPVKKLLHIPSFYRWRGSIPVHRCCLRQPA